MKRILTILTICCLDFAGTALAADQTNTFTFIQNCVGRGNRCTILHQRTIQTDNLLLIDYTAAASHCSTVRVDIYLDGVLKHTLPPLKIGEHAPLADLSPVSPGTHTIGFNCTAIDGCAAVNIRDWGGTVSIITGTLGRHLRFRNRPANTMPGVVITPVIEVEVRNPDGSLDLGFNGKVALAIENNPGQATLGGGESTIVLGGVAQFSAVTVSHTGRGYILRATADDSAIRSTTSEPFDIGRRLVFKTEPTDRTKVNQKITPPVRVGVLRADGTDDFLAEVPITVEKVEGPSFGKLTGTLTRTSANGVAVFDDLALNGAHDVAKYILRASAPDTLDTRSAGFLVIETRKLIFTVEPRSTVLGRALEIFDVTVLNDDLSRDTEFTGTIQVSAAHPFTGQTVVTAEAAAVGGVATFRDIRITKTGVGYTLFAGVKNTPDVPSGGAIRAATSRRFDITAPTLKFFESPDPLGTPIIGGDRLPTIRVAPIDANGDIVTEFTNTITLKLGTNRTAATLLGATNINALGGGWRFSGT